MSNSTHTLSSRGRGRGARGRGRGRGQQQTQKKDHEGKPGGMARNIPGDNFVEDRCSIAQTKVASCKDFEKNGTPCTTSYNTTTSAVASTVPEKEPTSSKPNSRGSSNTGSSGGGSSSSSGSRKKENKKKSSNNASIGDASGPGLYDSKPKQGPAAMKGATNTPDLQISQLTPPLSTNGSPTLSTGGSPSLSTDESPPSSKTVTRGLRNYNESNGMSSTGASVGSSHIVTPPGSSGSSPGGSGDSVRSKLFKSIECRDPPARPGFGTKGRTIRLYANHFRMEFRPANSCIYHYDVSIVPAKCPTHINRQVIWQLQEEEEKFLNGCKLAFDGKKNIYTSKPLPSVNGREPVKLTIKFIPRGEEKLRQFEIEIKLAAVVSLDVLQSLLDLSTTQSENHQAALQALDVIARTVSSMKFTTVGRSFFSSSCSDADLGQGRVAWFGRYQSVRPSKWGIVLNVDVSATAFYKAQPALQFMCEVLETGGNFRRGNDRGGRDRGGGGGHGDRGQKELPVPKTLQDYQRKTFANEIKGLKVEVTHLPYPRKYKVKGVKKEPANELCFNCEGKQCTVADYFKAQYKKPLHYPGLPCLHMEGKNNTIYIPIEVCRIVEQNCNRKLSPDQTAAMIRATAKPAFRRKTEILDKLREANLDADEVMNDFGIRVHSRMASVEGRVLEPPQLLHEGRRAIQPANGKWDIRNEKFYKGAELSRWAVVVFPQRLDPEEFICELCKAGHSKGMRMSKPVRIHYYKPRESVVDIFRGLKGRHPDLQLIVAILDGRTSYSEVKRVGDNMVGVITQCVKSKNASRPSPPTMSNICLKINTKLNGTNSIVDPRDKRALFFRDECVIIFGADVTHPMAGDTSSPSIAAVTASMDEHFMEYRAVAKVLKHRQEVMEINQLAKVVENMLIKFLHRNGGNKPTQILFFRDGVSEGQFKEVILKEIAAVQKACTSLEEAYKPGITFLVVQKRHHTRLFPADRKDECGKSGNIPAGTVVDTTIIHPREFDFFLCSHEGIQGTSKPCYYHVLWDDNAFTADSLQALTYQLCHCYARCTRSVSYPAPTYYSHLVAFRARYHLQDWNEKRGGGDSASVMSYSSDDLASIPSEIEEAIKLDAKLQDTMYFM